MDSNLQIVVSAVNDAAGPLAQVASSFNAIEDAAIAAAETTLSQWNNASASVEEATAGLSENFTNQMDLMNSSAAEAADAAATDWQASVSELQSTLAATSTQASEDFNGMAESAAASGEEMESSISSVGGKIQMVGVQLGILGAAIAGPAVEAVKAAGDQKEAFDQLGNSISNVYASASAPTAGLRVEIADVTAKIDAQKASIEVAEAALQKSTGTVTTSTAAHEKESSTIATAQINIQKLEQQLNQLTAAQSLAGGSAEATTDQFEAAARASTNLGFQVDDSVTALTYLFSSTQNVTETMAAYQDAMDLAAKLGIPVAQAANDLVQAMNGQGRALRDLGVNVADGLPGQTALAAVQEKVAGAAQLAATEGLGPMNVAQANLNKTMADFGNAVLPLLTSFFEALTKVLTVIDQLVTAHPKLAEALLIFLGLMGGALLILGAVLVPIGLLVISVEALNTVVALFGGTLVFTLGTLLLYVAAFAGFVSVVALIIVYHQQIMAAVKAAWDWIINEVSNAMLAIFDALQAWGGNLTKWWNDLWSGIVSVIQTAFNTVMNIVNSILSAISRVTGAVSGITGAVGGAVGNVFSGAIHAFASGGIVNGPTLALVGEAGPEAIIPLSAFAGGSSLGGGGFGGTGGIVVNVTGNNISSQLDLRNLAQQVGQEMVRVLRLNQKLSI